MAPLTEGAKAAAKLFGKAPTEQARAYYQIISAGATDAADATGILAAANKLAVGGVTDVRTAADGLTTVLNAYGITASRSEEVTDAMFVAMRAGKTTIGELSLSIGKVAPIAAQTGVALDDLLAAVAALTKGGIETRIAVNGVRAVLAAIAKPSTEAAELAAQLGINFSAAGLKSKGFAGFMAEVKEKTGGSTESLAKLFGGVESLVPVMALSGNAAKDYAAILADMAKKAGETEEAFRKMSEGASFKLDQLKASIAVIGIEFGDKLLKVVVPIAQAVVEHINGIIAVSELLAAVIASRVVTAFVLYTAQLGVSIVRGLQATAVLAGYSSTALLAAARLRILGMAANVAAGQLGILAGALRLLGGPIGAIITGLTLAATAWTIFGQKAEDASEKAIDQIHKMVAEFGNIPKPHQAILDAIETETSAIEKESARLRAMKADINANTSAAEAMMLAMGDVGAVNNLVDIEKQLDANAAKLK
jgi:TP901 family phage tail tape measure protein